MTTDIVYLDAVDLAGMIRRRELSALEVMDAHLAQIDALNPTVNAIVSADPEGARAAARLADLAQANGQALGPLHGLPVSYKDTHNTAGMLTTHGSPRHTKNFPAQNDLLVQRMENAGALRIGKTNVPEYAAGSHTVNRVFGATRNPHAPTRSAGGSSGGAAAALASGFQPIADGSDMGGSLRNPASFCNVVGLRPTPGLVPNAEAGNVFSPLATAGPMARNVDDIALLLSVIGRPDSSDPHSYSDASVQEGHVAAADLRGLRVGFAPTLGDRVPVDPAVVAILESQAVVFTELGATVDYACPNLTDAEEAFRVLRAAEFDAEFGEAYRSTPEEFNELLSWNIEAGASLTGRDILTAQKQLTRLVRGAEVFFQDYDIVLAPAAQLPPFDLGLDYPHEVAGVPQETYLDWMRGAYLFTPLGIPGISVPGGFTAQGLPVGIQLLSRRATDSFLLGVAKAYEDATRHGRVIPSLLEKTP